MEGVFFSHVFSVRPAFLEVWEAQFFVRPNFPLVGWVGDMNHFFRGSPLPGCHGFPAGNCRPYELGLFYRDYGPDGGEIFPLMIGESGFFPKKEL